jgi:hypothetical protein
MGMVTGMEVLIESLLMLAAFYVITTWSNSTITMSSAKVNVISP